MTARSRLAGILALVLTGGALVAGQSGPSQTPTFRAEVEYVEVDALVTDAEGRFVRDLTADDFEVLEDGRPQKIVNFSLVDIPVERFDRPLYSPVPFEPDVASNEEPFAGRVYVMVLDDLHTDVFRSERVRLAARQFIQRNLGANDLMAVVHTGGRSDAAQEFTNSRRLLLESVDAFVGRKLPSATVTRNDEYFRQRGMPLQDLRITDPLELERAHNARSTLEVLQRVAEWFGNVRGRRKTILFISEGIDYDITDAIRGPLTQMSSAMQVMSDIREAVAITARSNVSIYAIDPRGLTTLADETIEVVSFAERDTPVSTGPDDVLPSQAPARTGAGIGTSSLRNELFLSQGSLRSLSEETNGFAAINRNDFTDAFDRIVRDNSAYYVLAYYPPSTRRDGRFHRIEVRTRRPGLTVRSRRGYVAPRGERPEVRRPGGVSPEVVEALNSPLQVSGLGIRAFAAPFKGIEPHASVVLGVELLGRDLSLADNSKIELSYLAVDERGRTHGEKHDTLTMNLRPDTRTRVQETGLRVVNRMDLPPGRYQVRVAARDVERETAGSVVYDLEIPEFDEVPISISGVVLTSASGSALVTARADEELRGVLPAQPIAIRDFPQNDELALFAEVYDNSSSAPHRVDIVTTVRADDGTEYFNAQEQRDSSELGGASGGYGHTARIPLNAMPPGAYVLTVEARSRAGNLDPAVREIRFRVGPAR